MMANSEAIDRRRIPAVDKVTASPARRLASARFGHSAAVNLNPIKRAVRIDKGRLAAREATLKLYRDPERLAERLPTLRMLTRPQADIAAMARRLAPAVQAKLAGGFIVEAVACASEILIHDGP
jgi:L-seryl-tRNA(Ser) seleniumtransferase